MQLKAPKLTRRSLFKAAGASAAAVGAVTAVSGLAGCTDEDVTPDPTVVDEDSATSVLDEFELVDCPLVLANEWTLPLGSVIHAAEGSWLPISTAGSSATPMVKGSALSLVSGTVAEVVSAPLGAAATTVIYDVRCSDSAYAWVELDLNTRDWVLYASEFSGGSLTGDVKKLWEGTSDWDPAPFAVTGKAVVWQVQPSLSGSKTGEYSYCYLWRVGDAEAKAVVESQGRFAIAPTASGNDLMVLAPRVTPDQGVYYGVTAYTVSDDFQTKAAQLVMPKSVRPFRASMVGERFLVSVEASYSSGGLLGQMGTYIGSNEAGFVRFGQEPSEGGCGKGDVFIIKNRSNYAVVDVAAKQYSYLLAKDRSVDYGEYPARAGATDLFVTFATVKSADTGYPASVAVRTYGL